MWLERFVIVVPTLTNPRLPNEAVDLFAHMGGVVYFGWLHFLFYPSLYDFHQNLSHRLYLGGEGRKGEIDGRGSRKDQNVPAGHWR